jgi:CPA2 family monovalent cation:H+ antiporter-2
MVLTIERVLLVDVLPAILLFTAVVLIAKPLGVSLGSFAAGRGVQPSIRSGISLAQIGELSFVIAGIGVASGIARPSLLAIAVGVTCLTTLTSSVMIGRSEQIAQRIATSIPDRLGTFLSFYESWLGKLRSREATAWRRVRRPVFILIADAVAIVAIVIGGAQVHALPKPLIVLFVVLAMSPFAASLARRVAQVARLLSQIVIPAPGSHVHPAAAAVDLPLDLGASPRRALKMMLELAIAGVIAIPSIAATQPFIGTTGLVVITIVIALIAITYRSIVDFDQHVRAGSELILELLHQPQPEPLGHVETMLPGFSGLTSVTVGGSWAGRSLAELDLRARTGATVLAIARGEGGFATPEPTEPLRAGDVLALFGSEDAIAAARSALTSG